MFVTLRKMSLPLLIKELQEQAARRRTYLIRIAYVVLLGCSALSSIEQQLRSLTPLNVLGQGAFLLTALVNWQFWAIFLLLPGMTCGVLTAEKERNTLALLFLTRLGPWTIIMEKLLSRLFPMIMFLMCGLPVMAFTYSMGGLTLFSLFLAAYYLLLALWLTSCVAVMCSALNNTTVGAFIQTYFVFFAFVIGPHFLYFLLPSSILDHTLDAIFRLTDLSVDLRSFGPGFFFYQYGINTQILAQALSPATLFNSFNNPNAAMRTPWLPALCLGIPSLLSSIVCLYVARWALYRRAFVAPGNLLLKFQRGIDTIFFWAHRKVPFDVKLVREADSLPDTEPIAWREVSKRSLGQFRYLVRIMIPLMFPVIFVGTFMATSSANDWRSSPGLGLTPMVISLWAISLVLITITAANSIPLERTRQTWDVLRSVPLSGREILSQKLRGVRRLQWICSIPVISSIGLQTWWRYQLQSVSDHTPNFLWWEYLLGALVSVVIYSELVKWVSLWCGLTVRNSMRALLMSVLVVAGLTTLPELVLLVLTYVLSDTSSSDLYFFIYGLAGSMTPWIFITLNEAGELRHLFSIPLIPLLINVATQGGMLWLIHRHLMQRAEWYLGRIGVNAPPCNDRQTGLESSTEELLRSNPQQSGERNSNLVTPAGRV